MILETNLYISTQPAVCDLFCISSKLTPSEQRHPPNIATVSDGTIQSATCLVLWFLTITFFMLYPLKYSDVY